MLNDVIGIDKIVGMPVLSRASGNKLGEVYDLYIDPAQGILMGTTIKAPNGKLGGIDYTNIYSFGKDAVMVNDESRITVLNDEWVEQHPHAKKHLIGTNVMTEAGNHLGEIGNIYVRLTSPPMVIYELRGSMWDSLVGRNTFIYAASAGAISSNAERIIVPNAVVSNAASSLNELVNHPVSTDNTAARRNTA
ncbi:MAG TPA: PRC-barrel domain-containing protein [Pyrinomonadaceae bacterium]|jgi:uncharacterized protein YrrD|nr:PRC-barrel domain-containing protein [Pyrinomonadaceae bacterium]